ncbi:MAG TPA: hypothetical protein VI733_00515 [Candidatus Limnocylindria bacterium]|nr:hypothetical protein [Candidatus Limnocylindria bacterium]
MEPRFLVLALFGYAPIALLVFAPACAVLARRRNRDTETWFLLGAVGGPLAALWISRLPARPRPHGADTLLARRRRTPASRIPEGPAVPSDTCLLCRAPLAPGHHCQPEAVEDRIQRRWTVRVGGQRIIGPL